MSFREKIFIEELYKDAKVTLDRIFRKRRETFWGETPVLFRVRKYKIGGEVRNERVSVVKPQLHKVRLYSLLLGKRVEIQATPQMLRYIEASGGLDDYLLKTPDDKLFSDVASQLKVQLMQLQQAKAAGTLLPPAAAAAARESSQGEAAGVDQTTVTATSEAAAGDTPSSQTRSTKGKPLTEKEREAEERRQQAAAARRQRVQTLLQAAVNADTLRRSV